MHHVSEIRISNYKSISCGTFPLSYYTPLVGYNNAGKTNILRATAWVIKKSSLAVDDFNQVGQPIVVEADIDGISEDVLASLGNAHRGRIEPLVVNGRITIRRTQVTPGLPVAQIRLEVLTHVEGRDEWALNPTGIDAAVSDLFPDPIFVGAMENATEDVGKFGTSTTIGKLLKEIMTPVIDRHSPAVAEALREISSRLSANSDDKDEALVDLDRRIQGELSSLFPGVSVKTHIPVPAFTDFVKAATVRIFEDGFDHVDGRDVSSLGHGSQRAIQIALVKCLANVRRAAGENLGRTTLLLIDEPELYLHPQAIETVRSALGRLAESGYQVVVTTHSANMIARSDAPNALMIRRSAGGGTQCYPRIKDAVLQAIESAEHQSEALFALSNSNKILFSERVVIIEGKTERAVVPPIYFKRFGVTPGEDKVAMVDIGGTPNIPDTLKVIQAMGIPCKAIVDLDFVFRQAPQKRLIDEDNVDLLACRAILVQLRDDGLINLDAAGLPCSFNGAPAARAFELLSQRDAAIPHIARLHDLLKELGIWAWKKGAIESHLGIAKTSAAQISLISRLNDEDFLETMPDFESVSNAMQWLRS